jgi:hypothetical protein
MDSRSLGERPWRAIRCGGLPCCALFPKRHRKLYRRDAHEWVDVRLVFLVLRLASPAQSTRPSPARAWAEGAGHNQTLAGSPAAFFLGSRGRCFHFVASTQLTALFFYVAGRPRAPAIRSTTPRRAANGYSNFGGSLPHTPYSSGWNFFSRPHVVADFPRTYRLTSQGNQTAPGPVIHAAVFCGGPFGL